MIWHAVIMHATALVVVGYFVLFAAQRATGGVHTFGKYLSWWLFLLAALVVVLGIVFSSRHGGLGMHAHRWPHPMPGPAAQPTAPAPAPVPAPTPGNVAPAR